MSKYAVFSGPYFPVFGLNTEINARCDMRHAVFREFIWQVWQVLHLFFNAQKMNFSIKDFFSKCDQIRRKLQIWSHLLKKSFIENFFFCVVFVSFDFWVVWYFHGSDKYCQINQCYWKLFAKYFFFRISFYSLSVLFSFCQGQVV